MPGRQVVAQQEDGGEHGEAEHGGRGGGEVHGAPPEEDEEVGEGEAGGQPDHADHHGGEVGGGGEGRAGGAGAGAHQRHVVPEVSLRLPVKDLAEYLDNVAMYNRGSAELLHQTSNVFQINLF